MQPTNDSNNSPCTVQPQVVCLYYNTFGFSVFPKSQLRHLDVADERDVGVLPVALVCARSAGWAQCSCFPL